MVARFHYEDLIYEQLLADELPADKIEEINSHVEGCETCQSKLESLSQGTLNWADVQRFLDPEMQTQRAGSTSPDAYARCSMNEEPLRFLEPSEQENSLGRFGRYEIREILGRGGMGLVLRGFDAALNRHSAIKVLAPELAASAAARKRFSREAKSAAAVVHEHVIPILNVDEEQGLPYLVMPVIEGRSLEQRVNEAGPLETKEVLRIGMQIASGLAAAHAQGLVHRDVKPANILLENGVERVMITDFGLARAVDDASMTRSGVITGTPQYMSPEQSRGAEVDHRSDLFSLGSVLYFMCTGHSPFRAETTVGVLHRIVNDEPRSIQAVAPDIPKWLEEIVVRLLEKEPRSRYQSAEEVSQELAAWLAYVQQPDQVTPPRVPDDPSPRRKLDRKSPRRRRVLGWTGGLAFAITAMCVIMLEINKGTIVIQSAQSPVPIRIKRGGRVVKKLTVQQGNAKTRIAAGEYVVEVDGESDQLVIDDGSVSLQRGNEEIVRVSLKHRIGTNASQPGEIKWGPARRSGIQFGVRLHQESRSDSYFFGEMIDLDFYVRTTDGRSHSVNKPLKFYYNKILAFDSNDRPLEVVYRRNVFPTRHESTKIDETETLWGTCKVQIRDPSEYEAVATNDSPVGIGIVLARWKSRLRFVMVDPTNGDGLSSGDVELMKVGPLTSEHAVRSGKFPGDSASIAIMASPIANGYLQLRSMDRGRESATAFAERDWAITEDEFQIYSSLKPGKYSVSLMKDVGPRHVRIGIETVEVAANEFVRVKFPAPSGVNLEGRITGMKHRGLTSAVVTLRRKDDQMKSKSMQYIEADEAVGVEQDREFETMPLKEGWYEWSIAAYAPDNGQRIGIRLPGYALSGEIYVPASGQAEDLTIAIPTDYVPDLALEKTLLSKPTSAELDQTVTELHDLLIDLDEKEFAGLVTAEGIRQGTMNYIHTQREQIHFSTHDDLQAKTNRYFMDTVEPILLRIVAGEWPEGCNLEAWYSGRETTGQRSRMGIPISATKNNLGFDSKTFQFQKTFIRMELATPEASFRGHAFSPIELKGGRLTGRGGL